MLARTFTAPQRTPASPALTVGAATLTVALAVLVSTVGLLPLVGLVGASMFVGLVLLFRRAPHVAAALIVLGMSVQFTFEFFISPKIGPAKDAVALAGIAALVCSLITGLPEERRRFDAWLVGAVLLLMALYLLNAAGGHGTAWSDETRLVVEALGLLLVGYLGPQPRRTWKWTLGALVVAGLLNVFVGAVQQVLGPQRLILDFHYAFGAEVRETAGGQFRSFGTFIDPFSYAELLILALAAVSFSLRRSWTKGGVVALLVLGVVLSFVRTELGLLAMVAALALVQTGRAPSAVAMLLAVLLAGLGVLGLTAQTSAPGAPRQQSFLLSVNGRAAAWEEILRSPVNLIAGRGVGTVGEGLTRSAVSGIQPVARYQPGAPVASQQAGDLAYVDSTYLTTLAEVGLPGLGLLIFALFRMARIGVLTGRRGSMAGWSVVAVLAVVGIDSLTRSSMFAFPFGFIAMFVIGAGLAASEAQAAPMERPLSGLLGPGRRRVARRGRRAGGAAEWRRPARASGRRLYRPSHGLLAALLSRGGSRLFSLAFLVVLARHQSSQTFATYSYLLVLAAAAGLVTDSGVAVVAGRELARGQLELASAYRAAIPIQTLTAALAGAAVALVATTAPGPGATLAAGVATGTFIFANGILNLQGELLRGAGRPWVEATMQACAGALQLGLGSWVVLSGGGLTILFLALAAQQAILVAAMQCFLPWPWRASSGAVGWRQLLTQGLWLGGASTCLALVMRLPQLLLSNVASVSQTAHFAIASRYADLMATLCVTAGFGLLPAMSNRLSSGRDQAARFPVRILLVSVGAAVAVTPILVLLTPHVTTLIFGARYAGAGPAAQIIVGSLPVMVGLYMSWYGLIAQRRERRVLASGLCAVLMLGAGLAWIAVRTSAASAAEAMVAAVAVSAAVAAASLLTAGRTEAEPWS